MQLWAVGHDRAMAPTVNMIQSIYARILRAVRTRRHLLNKRAALKSMYSWTRRFDPRITIRERRIKTLDAFVHFAFNGYLSARRK